MRPFVPEPQDVPNSQPRAWEPDPLVAPAPMGPPVILPRTVPSTPVDPVAMFYEVGAKLEALEVERNNLSAKIVQQKRILERLHASIQKQAHLSPAGKVVSPLFAFDSSPYTPRGGYHAN